MLSPIPVVAVAIVSKHLEQTWPEITPVVELRTRFDRRIDRDLSNAVSDNRSYWDNRARIGFDFKEGDKISGRVRYQYAHTTTYATGKTNSTDESSDLYLGHIDFKSEYGTWSIGRQILKFGNFRLFEESNYGQRSKSFDLIRFSNKKLDLFAGKAGYTSNRSEQARLFGGAIRSSLGESLVYLKNDFWVTHSNVWTFDHRYSQKFDKGDWALEGAIQRGKLANAEVDAFWLHGRLNLQADPKTKLYVEGNIASGGTTATKNRRFDARYGTPHGTLGIVDVQSLVNLKHIELGVSHKPTKALEIGANYQHFWLYDKTDGWFGGTSINSRPGGSFIDPTGAAGNDVGSEINLTAKWDMTKLDSFVLETGVFFPGKFVKAFNGSSTANQYRLTLAYTRKF